MSDEEHTTSCTESGGSRPSAVKSDGLSRAGGFDTSGAVPFPKNDPDYGAGAWRWPVLDPFTQGYIEALLASCDFVVRNTAGPPLPPDEPLPRWMRARFSDLAPEALAAILKDCAAFRDGKPERWNQRENGPHFWALRQAGRERAFPPLIPYLGDDGKVRLRPAESDASSPSEASAGNSATDDPIPSSPSPTDVPSGKGEP